MMRAGILGASALPCGRFLGRPLSALAREAVAGAIADAGVTIGEIEAIFVGNALAGLIEGQECIRGEVMLRDGGFGGVPIFNIENACASGSSAFHLACIAIESGAYETVLVLGAEKMAHEDKTRPFVALEGALDVTAEPAERPEDRSVFMDLYATKARAHQERAGWSREDLARVVVKSRRHAAGNPVAQYRDPLTVEDVLSSRVIVDPLTLPMCSPIGDSAAALVLSGRPEVSRGSGVIRVLSSEARCSGREPNTVVASAARLAYERAGIGPEDVNVAEVHDAVASAEIEEYEHLGFAPEGEGHVLLRSGETALGGRLPVNTSGGLLSRGHPVGATGVLQIVELVDQLRGRAGARQVEPRPVHALAQNAGGLFDGDPAVAVVTILTGDQGG